MERIQGPSFLKHKFEPSLLKIHLMDLIAIIEVYYDKGNHQGGEAGNR